jgi:hypothetical protein
MIFHQNGTVNSCRHVMCMCVCALVMQFCVVEIQSAVSLHNFLFFAFECRIDMITSP